MTKKNEQQLGFRKKSLFGKLMQTSPLSALVFQVVQTRKGSAQIRYMFQHRSAARAMDRVNSTQIPSLMQTIRSPSALHPSLFHARWRWPDKSCCPLTRGSLITRREHLLIPRLTDHRVPSRPAIHR